MITAVIPMRDHHEDTVRVVTHLETYERVDHIIVIDNDSEDECCLEWLDAMRQPRRSDPAKIHVWRHEGRDNFYRMWNDARAWAAREAGRDEKSYLLVLNNDVDLWPDTARILAEALARSEPDVWITYPDWERSHEEGPATPHTLRRTKGTRNSGGMSGYCFMMDVRALDDAGVPPIHEGFELLCGDGDLILEVEARGGCAARVVGLPLDHRESTTQNNDKNADWTRAARWRDRRRSGRRESARKMGVLK